MASAHQKHPQIQSQRIGLCLFNCSAAFENNTKKKSGFLDNINVNTLRTSARIHEIWSKVYNLGKRFQKGGGGEHCI